MIGTSAKYGAAIPMPKIEVRVDDFCRLVEASRRSWPPSAPAAPDGFVLVAKADLVKPPPHDYWGAGEVDCPTEIKAPNGELHTLRCKRCGRDNPGNQICLAALSAAPTPVQPAASGWMDIATAPKDESLIDLKVNGVRHPDCYWDVDEECPGWRQMYAEANSSFAVRGDITHWISRPPDAGR